MTKKASGKKIVMVAACPFPANHGSPASIREMSEALVDLGNEVHIVTYPIAEDIPVRGPILHRVANFSWFKNRPVQVGPTPEKALFNPLMVIKLIWVILRYRIDVIHAHNYEGVLIGWLAQLVTRRPMLYNAVNNMTDELPTYDFFKNKNFARKLAHLLDGFLPFKGEHVTAVSDDLRDFLIGIGVEKSKVTVLPAGVFPEMFDNPDPEKILKRHQLSNEDSYLLYAGSLDTFQRLDYLLEVTQKVVSQKANTKLLIVGNISNDNALNQYKDMACSLGIADNVVFFDQVPLDELADYMSIADIAVIPRPECPGHPIKVLNYMSARKAIAGFRGGAKGLAHNESAMVVDNHDIDALAESIVTLLGDQRKRVELGTQARAIVDQYYTWQRLAQGIEVIYDHMLDPNSDAEGFRERLKEYVLESYSSHTVKESEEVVEA